MGVVARPGPDVDQCGLEHHIFGDDETSAGRVVGDVVAWGVGGEEVADVFAGGRRWSG